MECSHLKCQDISRLSFKQNLIHTPMIILSFDDKKTNFDFLSLDVPNCGVHEEEITLVNVKRM